MASIASSLQLVQTTIKDPIKATPESSGIRSAFGQLALGLATVAGSIGIAALAQKAGATIGASAPAPELAPDIGGKPGTIAEGAPPVAPAPAEVKGPGQKAQNLLLIAGVAVFSIALVIWLATRKKAR